MSEELAAWLGSCAAPAARHRRRDDGPLRAKLCELAQQRRRFGYRRLGTLMDREGAHVNHKRVYRVYAEEKLQVRRRRR